MNDNDGPIDLSALDAYLMSDESPENCMQLSDLDGFLTGIVVGPELIGPSVWLPAVWGGAEAAFSSDSQMRSVLGTIIGRYNQIAAIMASDPGSFVPILDAWPDDVASLGDWAAGFVDAIKLRRRAWQPLFRHARGRALLRPLLVVGDVEEVFVQSAIPAEQEFYVTTPGLLLNSVAGIQAFWRQYRAVRPQSRPGRPRPRPRRR